ncbi:FG-GAP repeat protein [Aquisphaera giovannonii]|uniref:FG-GAP repeat protein n=1 Tax=Aquisphaera giovannonii TaxID=406548 RepID=A0A5B9W962_9BACT|nr:VCBS repeat-containing protein [Aquisphaera giovannonii]QEH36957.1 FG-GAP repeat protein [Aquisphaera giovannonii]
MTGNSLRLGIGAVAVLVAGVQGAFATRDGGEEPAPVSWKKTTIEAKFRSEGVAIGDVNKDGKNDVLVGDLWYEAPTWTRHEIREHGDYGDGLRGYSRCMACWAGDVNGDGWLDEIVVGFPGEPAYWYENPRGQPGRWPEHEIWHSACNETPLYTDLFGDGRRVLVMGWQPKGKDDEGRMAWFSPGTDPATPWEMHAVSEPSAPGKPVPGTFRFSHGLGAGDLNGDGRSDILCTEGWWEQPPSARSASAPWAFHPAKFGDSVANILAYDANRDGKSDAIASCAHQYGIWWFEQGEPAGGSPAFVKHDLFPDLVSETHALIAADINGDGLDDLITGKRFWSHGKNEPGSDRPAKLYWFEAARRPDGQVSFTPRQIDDQSGIGTQFVVEDFNGDGAPDIVVSNKKGTYLFEQVRPRTR